jgi:hypothetical protein
MNTNNTSSNTNITNINKNTKKIKNMNINNINIIKEEITTQLPNNQITSRISINKTNNMHLNNVEQNFIKGEEKIINNEGMIGCIIL